MIVTNQHVDQTVKIKLVTNDQEERVSQTIIIGPQSVHSVIWR